jgi:hypothetical protein
MKITLSQAVHQFIIAIALFLSIGCAPAAALSDCEHDHPQNDGSLSLPDFGFNFNGACGPPPSSKATPADEEKEDELLKDIEKPPEEPSSDLAATLEDKPSTS